MRVALRNAAAGVPVLWGAPTYRQCRIGWAELQRAAGGVADFRRADMEVVVPPRDGVISFVSLDNPDNARGKTAGLAIIDEAGFVAEMAWYEVVRPMLSDTNGAACIGGTPKGHNWFWREFMAAADHADSIAWQAPTLGVRVTDGGLVRAPHPLENPDFPFAEAEAMFRSMPRDTFEQEFLAEFKEDAGGVFRRVREAATLRPQNPLPGHQYVMGVDWAKQADFTVLTVLDATTGELAWLDRFNQIDYRVQRARLAALAERYNPTVILAESNSIGEPNIEDLQSAGLPVRGFTTSNVTKAHIIEALALALEQGAIGLLDDPVLVAEMQAYELTRLPSGMVRYGAPEGMHDDCVISLALAWHAGNIETEITTAPSPYGALTEQEPTTRRERAASIHADTELHRRWAKKHFCPQCHEEYMRTHGDK
jgi:hypothetical protein